MTYLHENKAVGRQCMETYDGFGGDIVFFVVLLKVIEDLGARHCGRKFSPRRKLGHLGLPP